MGQFLSVWEREPKQIIFSFIQIILGMEVAILMTLTGHFLTAFLGNIGMSIAIVFMMTMFMYFAPKLKPINTIPAYFMGIIIFFGTHPEIKVIDLGRILLTIVSGFAFAWLTDKIELVLVRKN